LVEGEVQHSDEEGQGGSHTSGSVGGGRVAQVRGGHGPDRRRARRRAAGQARPDEPRAARLLWQVLETLEEEDRAGFIAFAYGSRRLPPISQDLASPFISIRVDESLGDSHLPRAHTCFFQLDLPNYSSAEILQEKLLYAIRNCSSIDSDTLAVGELNVGEETPRRLPSTGAATDPAAAEIEAAWAEAEEALAEEEEDNYVPRVVLPVHCGSTECKPVGLEGVEGSGEGSVDVGSATDGKDGSWAGQHLWVPARACGWWVPPEDADDGAENAAAAAFRVPDRGTRQARPAIILAHRGSEGVNSATSDDGKVSTTSGGAPPDHPFWWVWSADARRAIDAGPAEAAWFRVNMVDDTLLGVVNVQPAACDGASAGLGGAWHDAGVHGRTLCVHSRAIRGSSLPGASANEGWFRVGGGPGSPERRPALSESVGPTVPARAEEDDVEVRSLKAAAVAIEELGRGDDGADPVSVSEVAVALLEDGGSVEWTEGRAAALVGATVCPWGMAAYWEVTVSLCGSATEGPPKLRVGVVPLGWDGQLSDHDGDSADSGHGQYEGSDGVGAEVKAMFGSKDSVSLFAVPFNTIGMDGVCTPVQTAAACSHEGRPLEERRELVIGVAVDLRGPDTEVSCWARRPGDVQVGESDIRGGLAGCIDGVWLSKMSVTKPAMPSFEFAGLCPALRFESDRRMADHGVMTEWSVLRARVNLGSTAPFGIGPPSRGFLPFAWMPRMVPDTADMPSLIDEMAQGGCCENKSHSTPAVATSAISNTILEAEGSEAPPVFRVGDRVMGLYVNGRRCDCILSALSRL